MKVMSLNTVEGLEAYNRLACGVGNVFNTVDWLKMFGSNVEFFAFMEPDNRLIGGFSLYYESRFGLRFYRTPPFTPYTGPFLDVQAKNPVAVLNKWKEAITLMAKTIESRPYAVVSTFLNRGVNDTQPFIWNGFKVVPNYTYVIDLSQPSDQIWQQMSPERRNDLSKGIRDGLVVRQNDDPDVLKMLVLKTFERQNKSIPISYLDKILYEFATSSNSYSYVCWRGDLPISAAFCVHDNHTAYYLLGGFDHQNKHHAAGPLSLWECVKHAQAIGLNEFDFEGSMVPDIERYFRGFGGNMVPYYRVNKALLPLEIVLKFVKRELF